MELSIVGTIAFRGFVIAVIVNLLMWFLKKYKAGLKGNKNALISTVLVLCIAGAVLQDWYPDGVVTVETAWPIFAAAVSIAELEYAWLIKWLESLKK